MTRLRRTGSLSKAALALFHIPFCMPVFGNLLRRERGRNRVHGFLFPLKNALFQALGFRNAENVLSGKGQVAFVPGNHFKVVGIL